MTDADWTFDDVQAEYRPATATVAICLDGQLVAELERLDGELRQALDDDARVNRKPQAPAVAERIRQLQEDARGRERTFVFQAVPHRRWSDLLAEHKPTKEQRDQGLDHNPDTFAPVAIAEAAVAPKMTVDQARWLWDNLSLGQAMRLWRCCLSVNVGVRDVPFNVAASAVAHASEPSSTTADRAASPDPSSSDGR